MFCLLFFGLFANFAVDRTVNTGVTNSSPHLII